MTDNKPALPVTKKAKKPYHRPELQVYGDLRDITQSTMLGKTQDSSKGKANKTTP